MSKHKVDEWLTVALMASWLGFAVYFGATGDAARAGVGAWFAWVGAYRFWPGDRMRWWFAGMVAVVAVTVWSAVAGGA